MKQLIRLHGDWLVPSVCVAGALVSHWTSAVVTPVGGTALHAGIAVAVFWAGTRRQQWSLFLAILLCNAAFSEARTTSWQLTAAHAGALAGATALQGWFAAACLRRALPGAGSLDSARTVVWFLLLAAFGSSLVPAALVPAWLLARALLARTELAQLAAHIWLSTAIGVSLGAPLMLTFIGAPASAWRSRRLTLGIPLCVGIAIMALGFLHTSSLAQKAARAAFREDAAALSNALEHEFAYVLAATDGLAQLWIASEHIERTQFQRAAERVRRSHSAILSVAWLPRVTRGERAAHELAGRASIDPEYAIKERSAQRWQVAAVRDEYYPVFYLDPSEANHGMLGFDFASEPVRAATLHTAVSTHKASVSPGVFLLEDRAAGPSVLALIPTVEAAPRVNPRGLILCVLRLEELLRLTVEHAGHAGVALRLEDVGASGLATQLASFGADNGAAAEPDSPYVLTKSLAAGDRTWRLTAWRKKEQVAMLTAWQGQLQLMRGLLFASLLSGFLLIVTGKMAQIEAVVVARTAALSSVNQSLISEINTRSEAERALAVSDARWQFALEGGDTGVLDWDLGSQAVFYSAQWKQLLGYGPDAPGPSVDDWTARVHPDDVADCRAQLSLLFEGVSDMFHLEHRMLRNDDSRVIWTATRAAIVQRAPSGRALRIIGTQRDITARKESERELAQHRDHLDALVRVRTHDLEQARLLAQRADAAKSLFLRNMSHELMTPLHGILSFAQLGAELENSASHDYFTRIVASAEQLNRIVANVLELASLEIDQRPLQKSIIDLHELIRTVADEMKELLDARTQSVVFQLAADVVSTTLEGDSMQLRNLFRHLLANASRYSPAATTITVSFARCVGPEASASDMIEVRLIDRGVGIPADEAETIFQSFVQGSRTRSNAGGTGIGLAICRAIVVQHGGSIRAHSSDSEVGTTIIVRLPVPSARQLAFAS